LQNSITLKKHVPNILQTMSRLGSHAKAHQCMEYRHDICGLDVLR